MTCLSTTSPAPSRTASTGRITSFVCLLTILCAGCELTTESGLNPTAPSALAALFVGNWTSSSAADLPTPDSCSNLEWSVVEEGDSTYSGSFRATCGDGVDLDGTLRGTLVGEVLNLSGSGTVTAPGATGCSFTLTGTARVVGDALQLDYAGSTCLGPVSGTEILLQV